MAVNARPFQAARAGQPFDVFRRAHRQILDQRFVQLAFAFRHPALKMLFRCIVLIRGELFLIGCAGCLHNAAGQIGSPSGNARFFQNQHLRSSLRGRCGRTNSRAAGADD